MTWLNFQWPDDKFRKLEDQVHLRFIKRLVFFYKPTNHIFSRTESDHELERKLAVVGCQLIDFLVRCDHEEGIKQLMDLLTDIGLCLSEVGYISCIIRNGILIELHHDKTNKMTCMPSEDSDQPESSVGIQV